MAIVALANLGLVLFDLSYVPAREFYLRNFWNLQNWYEPLKKVDFYQLYDPIKGIEPHRDTQKYLKTIEKLKVEVEQNGLLSAQAQELLKRLRNLSVEMIDENPFQIANKSGSLEKIKNRMRRHIFNNEEASAKESFRVFWSEKHLRQAGWEEEIRFFERDIQPLIASNYYRGIGEDGEFINRFWEIDRWFIGVFWGEFLMRTWLLSRRYCIRWIPDACMWRWYDIFLLLPFWQFLRVISVLIRLHKAKFPDLEPMRNKISQWLVISLAEELTEVVVIKAIEQLQEGIKKGEIVRSILKRTNKGYIDINGINELQAIASRMLQITFCKVLPAIQADLEALLRHNIATVISKLPAYQGLQRLPGGQNLPNQLSEQLAIAMSKLVTEVPKNAYNATVNMPPDPVSERLSERLVEHFSAAFREEIQQQHTIQELESLISDMLEEFKLNYVKRISAEELDRILKIKQQQQLTGN
ncbi:MAG TPA: hypothetical protein IGR89_11180 [Oscillatoriaceae cyanobacterium M7585_C2015_266]|nr:hypothetical protein [Oscillatoriaceae cyanobacterium M7585_C2015_266]